MISFETEFIIVDDNNKPVNKLLNVDASSAIISILSVDKPELIQQGVVVPELDASQIEIKNSGAKQSLNQAISEIIIAKRFVEKIVKEEFGLSLLNGPVPNQDFAPMYSENSMDALRYKKINDLLMKIGLEYRKSTNVAGIHMHRDLKCVGEHSVISNAVRDCLIGGDHDKLYMGSERLDHIIRVVEGLKQLGMIDSCFVPQMLGGYDDVVSKLFDKDGNLIFNYSLQRLKRFDKGAGVVQFTSEMRTGDSCSDDNLLVERMEGMSDFFDQAGAA